MSRHTLSRIDRVAQMSMQEEIIARKKLEIIEKQKTAELAKQVVAAQSCSSGGKSASSKKEKVGTARIQANALVDEVTLPKNSFNNDGSFFENFKKITDAAKIAQKELEDKLAPPIVTTLSQANDEAGIESKVESHPDAVENPQHTDESRQFNTEEHQQFTNIEQEVDAFIAEFPPAAAVLCAKPPPPPPPPLPEPPSTGPVEHIEQTSHMDFHNCPPSFGTQPMQSTFGQPPKLFPTLHSVPPPPSQHPFFSGSHDSIPVFQANIAPPLKPPSFFGPPPMLHDSQPDGFSNTNPIANIQQSDEVPIKHTQLPPDFNINQPPPDFKADQLPPDFSLEKPPPQIHFAELKSSNSGSSSPIGAIRFDQENDKNELSVRPVEQTRSNPFSVDRKFPPPNIASGDSSRPPNPTVIPSYTNPFSKPPNTASQMFPQQNQTAAGPNRFAQNNFAQPSSLPSTTITSVPPPNAMFQFRSPPMFGGQQQPQQIPSLSTNPLHAIPPPKPMQLNKIPAPQELDLTAIPEPKLNLDAIKVPDGSDISRDHDFIPTSVESLVELVAENGDDYEDKLRSRKIDMHSSLWFLCEKGSMAYRKYRKRVLAVRYNGGQPIDDDEEGDEMDGEVVFKEDQDMRVLLIPPISAGVRDEPPVVIPEPEPVVVTADTDKYDPADMFDENEDNDSAGEMAAFDGAVDTGDKSSERSYDSDSEYMSEAKKRNFVRMKRKQDIDERLPFGGVSSSDSDEGSAEVSKADQAGGSRKKRSRWGDQVANQVKPAFRHFDAFAGPASGTKPPMLSLVTRSEPALLAYAHQSYGTVHLDEETWRKCEDHFKVNLLYQDMLRKRNEMDRLAKAGRQKYEYDSDEDVQGGTWEHKLRNAEMEATAVWSDALTKQAEGKHHIGDFLPPEELKKFMEKYDSQQTNREPDLSDYREYKLREDNKGFQMLQKLGWKEGQGLGFDGAGIVDPVNKAQQRDSNQGLGSMNAAVPEMGDNEYEAYRKRMMLAYRFRPNPLNNPRRSYY